MSGWTLALLVVAALLALPAAWVALAGRAFARRIGAATRAVEAAPAPPPLDLTGLPPVWQEWLAASGALDVPAPPHVVMTMRGRMWMAPGKAPIGFTADQHNAVSRRAFVWAARFPFGPFALRVVDALVDGLGWLEGRFLGGLRVVHVEGPETDRGELIRWLAEVVWTPWAIAGAADMTWEQPDPRTAVGRFTRDGHDVEMTYTFDEDGAPVRITCPDRPREPGERCRWICEVSELHAFDGVLVPRRGRVSWDLPGGPFTYWEGEILTWRRGASPRAPEAG